MKNLEIGSIVILKGGNKKLMIFGKNQIRMKDKREFDYLGCFYPEGFIHQQLNVFFNANDISKIIRNLEGEKLNKKLTTGHIYANPRKRKQVL